MQDNGRGIPTGIHPTTGKSALETVLTILHAGGKFGGDDSGYKVSGGLHGVGVSVVNALSSHLSAEVFRDNKRHVMRFEQGVVVQGLEVQDTVPKDGDILERGTRVCFKPDPAIFKTTLDFDFDKLAGRVDELAYLNAGLTLKMIDRRSTSARNRGLTATANLVIDGTAGESVSKKSKKTGLLDKDGGEDEQEEEYESNGSGAQEVVKTYRHDGGISELVSYLTSSKQSLHDEQGVITVQQEKKGVLVEAALQWSKDMYSESLTGFANGIRTIDGGTHIDGLKGTYLWLGQRQ